MSSIPEMIVAAVQNLFLSDTPPAEPAVVEAAEPVALALPPPTPDAPTVMLLTEYDSPADVVLPIRSRLIPRITIGLKNHDFRNYLLHSDVQYVWLWEDEAEVIRYIITTGVPKRPGEINDPTGDGNKDFDAGRNTAYYGYPIYEVYRLPCDLSRVTLLEEYGMDMEEGRQYVKQALVDAFPLDTLYRNIPLRESEEDEAD